MSPDKDLTDKT